jgi:hypothetical protein
LSYDNPLSEAEFAHFAPNAEVLRYLEHTRQRLGLSKREMNVLDWGSGRGEYVAWLRDAGYNAFGAEIRKEAAERGRDLIETRGHDYVLEHVADIDAVTREIARVLLLKLSRTVRYGR